MQKRNVLHHCIKLFLQYVVSYQKCRKQLFRGLCLRARRPCVEPASGSDGDNASEVLLRTVIGRWGRPRCCSPHPSSCCLSHAQWADDLCSQKNWGWVYSIELSNAMVCTSTFETKHFGLGKLVVSPRFRYVSKLFALVEVRSCFSMLWPPTRHNKAASSTTLRPPSNYCVLKKDATARRREESTILNGTGTSLESSHEATSLELID